ncbi:hypothetical protein DL95DRAFT_461398 [Leptodontidium sp. 2 PMI_412]|nr:hypothetical protein DL95DRAFT_461398 [Leptodontidium sp. 2 PMI_412]
MVEPAVKKAKLDNFLPPIIFESPYFPKKPDVRLTIFNQQMHVHSETLKMKSQFFNAFLDSPGTVDQTSYAGFKYEWVAKIDDPFREPKDWGLRWLLTSLKKDKYPQYMDAGLVKGWPEREKDLFQKLLRIFYHDPYKVIDWGELETMTEIADYL